MAQVVETIDVNVPVSTAYNQWTQFEKFPQFLSFVESVTQIDDTHLHWRVNIAGGEREFDSVITEQIPDDRVAWTSTGGEVDHAGVVTFHRLSDTSSRVAVQIDWEPEGFVEKAGAALDIPDRAVRAELENFKKFIESRGAEDGAWRGTVEN
ncbi:MAG: cyclase [Rhodoglobus sp.]|nr:cyclase [Rhodoglobus sp.]